MSILRATITGTHYGTVTCQNVLHFDNPEPSLTLQQCANELRDNWCTTSAVARTSQFGFRSIKCEKLGSTETPFTLPIAINGSDLSDNSASMPPVCVKWILRTDHGGRKGRGRIYQAGYRAAYWQSGTLTATGITNITGHINTLMARYMVGGTGPLKLKVGPRVYTSDSDYRYVTSVQLSLTPGIQRRRTVGVGI